MRNEAKNHEFRKPNGAGVFRIWRFGFLWSFVIRHSSFPGLVLAGLTSSSLAEPRHVYLTWQGDTSTTMTVNYQTMEAAQTSMVYYDTQPRQEKIGAYRFRSTGTRHKIKGLEDGRTIHWVELSHLKPGETYY